MSHPRFLSQQPERYRSPVAIAFEIQHRRELYGAVKAYVVAVVQNGFRKSPSTFLASHFTSHDGATRNRLTIRSTEIIDALNEGSHAAYGISIQQFDVYAPVRAAMMTMNEVFLATHRRCCQAVQRVVDIPDQRLRRMALLLMENAGHIPDAERAKYPEITDEELAGMGAAVLAAMNPAKAADDS